MNWPTTTPEQRQRLITAYLRTGNMAASMREADIRSPRTAYLWWRRFTEGGVEALRPRLHARKTQQRLPAPIPEEICQLRRQEPRWGRRRIANALTQRYGRQVASPASVEAVLRRAGLWEQTHQPAPPAPTTAPPRPAERPSWRVGGIDYGRLLETIQRGIRLDIQSDARGAVHVLYREVWRPIEDDSALWSRLLTAPEVGVWLLRSRLHLSHSLMNCGVWPLAAQYAEETIAWMQEHPVGSRQRAVEEEPHFVSLRRDDIWLGCFQHLGLILGKSDIRGAIAYLQTALNAMRRPYHPVAPDNRGMIGDLERDLAYLTLRLRRSGEEEIRQRLLKAQQSAEEVGSPGIQAFTHIAWARFHDRLARAAGERERGTRRQYLAQMEQALERALDLVEEEQVDRPMRQTICFVDAAQLAHAHGMPLDGQRIQRAAAYCLAFGYGDQARSLRAIPGVSAFLSEDDWRNLAKPSLL